MNILVGSPPVSLDADSPGYYKKKDQNNENIFFAGSQKTKKRNRNERRLSFKKGLNHNPETFKQFASLGLEPPASAATVEKTKMKLEEKLRSFEIQAADIKLKRLNKDSDEKCVNGDNSIEIPEIKVDDNETNGVNALDSDIESLHSNSEERKHNLKLDLKFTCIPEITIDNIAQSETIENPTDQSDNAIKGGDDSQDTQEEVETIETVQEPSNQLCDKTNSNLQGDIKTNSNVKGDLKPNSNLQVDLKSNVVPLKQSDDVLIVAP